VVPVAGQQAVLDGPLREREGKAHVGTAVVDGVDPGLVVEQVDRVVGGRDDHPARLPEVVQGATRTYSVSAMPKERHGGW
jgi:hypothetical protein